MTGAPTRDAIYVGLMSGTSLDGISAAVVRIRDDGHRLTHDLLGYLVQPYTDAQRARLLAAMEGGSAESYCRLTVELGGWLAAAAVAALNDAGVARADVRAIASHGQTLWHVPAIATWQVGEAAVIAERTGIDVVSNFRARDVAAGGHGAPLVPLADALLYADGHAWRLLQNVGGMANVTVVPPSSAPSQLAGVRAFDTGPGMAIVDAVTRALRPELPYDVGGALAREGTVLEPLVAALLDDPYFAAPPPKSTGREQFGPAYADTFITRGRASGASDADLVATAVALTARSIALAYARFVPEPASEVLLSGGGAKHPVLTAMLERAIAPRVLRSFDAYFYDAEAKEAVAFALLAHRLLARQPGNVTGATGARGPRVLGTLTPA